MSDIKIHIHQPDYTLTIKRPAVNIGVQKPALQFGIKKPGYIIALNRPANTFKINRSDYDITVKRPAFHISLNRGIQGPPGPAGQGGVTLTITAGEDLTAKDLICIGSTGEAFKADANDPAKECIGYVNTTIPTGEQGTAYLGGWLIDGLTGLNPSGRYFLSKTPGTAQLIGDVLNIETGFLQQVGIAISATSLYLEPKSIVYLGGIALDTNFITTETGDSITTETGDNIILE